MFHAAFFLYQVVVCRAAASSGEVCTWEIDSLKTLY